VQHPAELCAPELRPLADRRPGGVSVQPPAHARRMTSGGSMPPLLELLEGARRGYDCEEPPAPKLATLEGCGRHYRLPLTEAGPLVPALLSLPLVRSPRACPCPFSSCSSLSGLSAEACSPGRPGRCPRLLHRHRGRHLRPGRCRCDAPSR